MGTSNILAKAGVATIVAMVGFWNVDAQVSDQLFDTMKDCRADEMSDAVENIWEDMEEFLFDADDYADELDDADNDDRGDVLDEICDSVQEYYYDVVSAMAECGASVNCGNNFVVFSEIEAVIPGLNINGDCNINTDDLCETAVRDAELQNSADSAHSSSLMKAVIAVACAFQLL